MKAVKNTVQTGRTVVCTIHQPSMEIFAVSFAVHTVSINDKMACIATCVGQQALRKRLIGTLPPGLDAIAQANNLLCASVRGCPGVRAYTTLYVCLCYCVSMTVWVSVSLCPCLWRLVNLPGIFAAVFM